ncbi:MAG: RNA polymerase factor sigma-54 [Acidaminococcus sp.]|uniref:RNA polymerase factor sigma-54 n=1 Tax=Acidaminococcus sp. TaxID=1872103 RepID=UPI003F178C35
MSPEERQLARYIIGTLDGNGWWRENVDDTAKAFGVEPKLVEAALHRVQQLEPAGVGARSLAQCLELQLPPEAPELVRQIIREGLELLGQNQIPALAKKFRTTKQAVLAAKDIICSLDPKPGARYASSGPVAYQREDVRVDAGENGLTLTVYDTWGGKFVLNQEYLDWGKEQGNAQVKAYLKEQLGKARQLQQLLKARQQTLLQVFQALVTHQEPFFRLGPGHKQPLKLANLAEETGLAISTVSRALQHKAIGCRWGCFEAGSFLVGEAASQAAGTVTEERLQQLIRQVIAAEDKQHPLSDQAICETLERQGVHTARRTVNKYRVKLGIPGKSGRKVWE